MKIVEITRSSIGLGSLPQTFGIGVPVFEGGRNVKEILYCRDGYTKGEKGRFPSYVVKFEGTDEVRVIPEHTILDMAIDPETEKKKKSTEAVDLPD